MSTIESSVINEGKKIGLVLLHDPSGRKNRCFYQCLAFHLGMDVHEVITTLEEFMLENQFLSIKNEVTF
jgi:membrane-bound inhibitor of C-type lysozyme